MAFAAFADHGGAAAGTEAEEPDRALPPAARHPLPGAVLPHAARSRSSSPRCRRRASSATSASTTTRSTGRTTSTVVQEYWPHILRSFGYALAATVFALLFSYPLAYFIGVKARRWPLLQSLMLVLVIAPFFISFLLRTLAWKQLLSDESFVITSLKALSLMAPDAHFTGTPFAVIFGLTYNFIPFMTLPLYTTLERLDLRYLEAGSDLYANPFTVFRKVTIPLSMPGIVAGTLLTFIPAAGDYVNASRDFLGGPDTQMMGNVIEANFLVLLNYPAAAALSIILMAAILVLVGIYVKRSGTEDLL